MNTGNNLLYMVLSLLLSFLVLSGVLSESALRGLSVRRRFPGDLHAGQPGSIVLEVHNAQRRVPSFAVVVEDLLGEDVERADERAAAGRVFAFRIGPGETVSRRYGYAPERRGDLQFGGFRVSTRFPFGLFSKAMRIDSPGTALVYPAVSEVPVQPPAQGGRSGEPSPAAGGHSPEAAGLRPFAPGDAHRRIHWRASLRRDSLLVRDRAREQCAEKIVRLRTGNREPGPGFERDVSQAASEVVAHVQAGYRVGLVLDGAELAPGHGHGHAATLLARLARVEPAPA